MEMKWYCRSIVRNWWLVLVAGVGVEVFVVDAAGLDWDVELKGMVDCMGLV